jgi:hypothetical protein
VRETVPAEAGAVVAVGDRPALARELAVRLRDGARADAEGVAGRLEVESAQARTPPGAAIVRVYEDLLEAPRPLSDGAASTVSSAG